MQLRSKLVLNVWPIIFATNRLMSITAAEARGFHFCRSAGNRTWGWLRFPFVNRENSLTRNHSYSYELEYGTDTLEMHIDGISEGQRVLVVDDLLATGRYRSSVLQDD